MYRININIFSPRYISVFVRQYSSLSDFKADDSWVILSPVEQNIKAKIERIGTRLKDWDISIYRGILTGLNEAFIITKETRDKLIAEDSKSAEIIRPILRGRDIKRYGNDFSDLWLLYIPWHFPLQNDPTITGPSAQAEEAFKRLYPAVYNHLLQYKTELTNRNKAETGIRYEWYALQRWGANYWEEFNRQKIVWGNLNLNATYSLAEAGMYINAPCTLIVPANKYLLAVLNSKLADYYIRNLGVTRNGGYFEYKPMFVEKLPVPILSEIQQFNFSELVNAIIEANKRGVNSIELENQIDKLVYEVYGLDTEEINFIKNVSL